jgi:hypothetical protein
MTICVVLLVPVLGVAVPVKHVRKTFHFVASYTILLLPLEFHLNCIFHLAVCSPSCLNGGTCTAPNTCQCIAGIWSGNICQTRE